MKLEIEKRNDHGYLSEKEDGNFVITDGGLVVALTIGDVPELAKAEEQTAKDIAHRYNMHDKLVGALKEMVDVFACIRPEGCVHIKVARKALKEAKDQT